MTVYDFYEKVCGLRDKVLIERLADVTKIRHLKKGECLIRVGEVVNDIYLLESGIVRGYFIDEKGGEVTDCFGYQCGYPTMPFCDMDTNTPSLMTIEVLKDSSFFCIPISVVQMLQRTNIEMCQLYNRMLTAALSMHWKMKQVLHEYPALERYRWFLQEYPGLIDEVSNKCVASFLGMTPVTFSRLGKSLREESESEKEKKQ